MITFHPEVHLSHFEEQKELLKTRALQNEIILLLECKQYNASSENRMNGFEQLEGLYPDTVLCSTYTLSQVPFETLKEGGNHSIAVLVFFLYCILIFPEMEEFMRSFETEPWFLSYTHFLQEIHFNIYNYEKSSENMKQHIRNRAKLYGGLPSNIPYESIRKCCLYMLHKKFPDQNVDDIVIQKTLLEREKHMAENIIDVVRHNKNIHIHICIGAGHLMPFLNERQIAQLGLDIFFSDYHKNITQSRLLHYLQKKGIDYAIEC